MIKLLCVFLLFSQCFSDTVKLQRNYIQEENDINFKRYILVEDSKGEIQSIDLLAEEHAPTKRASVSDVKYYLYTQRNENDPQIITNNNVDATSSSVFNSKNKNVFIIHGWVDDYTGSVNTLNKAAILKKADVNIFVVDWSPIAAEFYTTAQSAVTSIGEIVGAFINSLISKYNLNGSDFILIGHSLGAHIAGNAGSVTTKQLDYIIGLDPAGPLFSLDKTNNRLDTSDAKNVEVLHTNGALLGFSSSIGHQDFYPNGGNKQPGCGLDIVGTCSHVRANELLAEAIENGPNALVGTLCNSYTDFQRGICSNNKKHSIARLFETVDREAGDYFLTTSSTPPYAI